MILQMIRPGGSPRFVLARRALARLSPASPLMLLAVSAAAACSVVVDADRVQCKSDVDCTGRGGAFADSMCVASLCQPDSRWSCLDETPTPSTETGPFAVAMRTQDLLTQQPKAGVKAELCNKVDVDCSAPLFTTTSDATGLLTLQVPGAFSGYVLLQAPDVLPGLYFFNPSIDRDQEIPPILMPTPLANSLLVAQIGGTQGPNHGHALVMAEDCNGSFAAGVSYATADGDAMTKTFYSVSGLPSASATTTDSDGYGGMINLPSGAVTLTGDLAAKERTIGTISLLVRAGAISYSRIVPRGE
jgi:hypothetical protein